MSTQSEVSKLLSPSLINQNQQQAIDAIYEKNQFLYAKMGAGKTIIAATAITELLEEKHLTRVLVVTTPKIANTVWRQEFSKWEHTQHINIGLATNTPLHRKQTIANDEFKVVVITFNTLQWMKDENLFQYFDGLLIDEGTKLKESGSQGFKALRNNLKNFKWRCVLSGTPASENFQSLFALMFLIDCGKTLGTRKDHFLGTYFFPTDFKQYNWELKEGADKELIDNIRHLIYEVPDYRAELPALNVETIKVKMPADLREKYNEMKKHMLVDGIAAPNAAVRDQKLQQLTSGFLYDEENDTVKRYSKFRIYALLALLEKLNTNVIISAWYQEDKKLIKHYVTDAQELSDKTVRGWNNKEIKHLVLQPRSASHGLQLEQGGHTLVMYNTQWSNDVHNQLIARLWRKGQTHQVNVYILEVEDSIDEIINLRVESKEEFDQLLQRHLNND